MMCSSTWGRPGGSLVKNLPAKVGDIVQSLSQEHSLEKEMATHSSINAWEIPQTEESRGQLFVGSQKSQTHLSD